MMDSADWYLIFDPLDREDYGELSCMLSDTGYNNSIYLRRRLFVYSQPFVVQSSSKDIDVNEGENILLKCFAQGLPPPQIQWMKADASPLPDGNIRAIGVTKPANSTIENSIIFLFFFAGYSTADQRYSRARSRHLQMFGR